MSAGSRVQGSEPDGAVQRQAAPFGRSDYPTLYAVVAQASTARRKIVTWATRIELVLLILTSALVASETPVDNTKPLRIATAVVLAVARIVKFGNRLLRSNSIWFDARAVAEGVKSQSWQYMMRTQPYDGSEPEARTVLPRGLDDLLKFHPLVQRELHRLPADQRQVTP